MSILSSGAGKSKKVAKRQAAYKMMQKLKDLPAEPSQMGLSNSEQVSIKKYFFLKNSALVIGSHGRTTHLRFYRPCFRGFLVILKQSTL